MTYINPTSIVRKQFFLITQRRKDEDKIEVVVSQIWEHLQGKTAVRHRSMMLTVIAGRKWYRGLFKCSFVIALWCFMRIHFRYSHYFPWWKTTVWSVQHLVTVFKLICPVSSSFSLLLKDSPVSTSMSSTELTGLDLMLRSVQPVTMTTPLLRSNCSPVYLWLVMNILS